MTLVRARRLMAGVALAVAPGMAPAQDGAGDTAALLRSADSLFRAGAHDAAFTRYAAVLARDSTVSRAVFQMAVLRSWRNELDVALRLHRRYMALEPNDLEGRVAYARVLAWAGRFAPAVAAYDTVLAREPDYRDAALGRATVFGWWSRFDDADAAYAAWIASHPADTLAVLDRARVLSWAGRLDAALAIYTSYGDASPEAAKGAARVRTWQGDLLGGEVDWAALARRYPDDAEIWVGLAQVRRWLDRPRAARDALTVALRLQPGHPEALQLMQWVDADLRPSGGAEVVVSGDSDDNTSTTFAFTGAVRAPAGRRVSLSATRRNARFRAFDAHASTLRAAWGVQTPSGRVSLAMDAAVTRLESAATGAAAATDQSVLSGGARVSASLGARATVGAGAHRSVFDEVAATIASGVRLDLADLDASVRLPARIRLGAALSTGAVTHGADGDNERWGASAALRWSAARHVEFAVTTRAFGYERTAADGYFAPRRFQLTQLTAHWNRPSDLGWQLSGNAGVGRQRLRVRDAEPTQRLAWDASTVLGFRWRPGVEWYARAVIANVASPGTVVGGAEYRYGALAAGVRWLF